MVARLSVALKVRRILAGLDTGFKSLREALRGEGPIVKRRQQIVDLLFSPEITMMSTEADVGDLWTEPQESRAPLPSRSRPLPSPRFSESREIPLARSEEFISFWSLQITPNFKRSIENVDKKIKGRILEALTELILSPTEIRGDTIKPLTGDQKGLWRYRIGDFRLIYRPQQPPPPPPTVQLLTFGPRSEVYS
jgi:mRNA-degrading endonuclease RelE of RelBE toxin-antitoxin system